ncbi:MAG TPA: hypothetical protein VNP94_00865 [Actinomycetota bacterium]|nr:hypothetical protein [Actinomycetota bacterium]
MRRYLRRSGLVALASGLVLALGLVPAGAHGGPPPDFSNDDFFYEHHTQHGPTEGHLPGSQENVELVGKLRLTSFTSDISDVSALRASNGRWYAYLGDWGAKCETGGIHVVDITNPAKPRRVGFLASSGFGYRTEGVQALHVDSPAFTGDILVASNEWCRVSGNPKNMPGGITIYDITKPTGIKVLVDGFGDFDLYGNRANESHSAIAWDAGDHVYAALIDNEELEDVDLFDISDPRNPVKLSETDLPGVTVNAYGNEKFAHDLDVLQRPDGTWHLMVSDWDAGWIDVDVTNPSSPTIVGDFDYAACDPVVATACPPEGNAHQGEWISDGSVFVGTDEDFSPFRLPITVTDGPLAGQVFAAGEFGWTKPVATFPDGKVNGPTVFGGYGCPDDVGVIPPPSVLGSLGPDEEKIIVFQRGPVGDPNHPHDPCFFSDKVRAGEEAGYDVVIIANHHAGAGAGAFPDAFLCGGQGSPVHGTAAGLCVGHRFMHEAFGTTPDYAFPYPSPAPNEPAVGTLGPRIEAASVFDGWGYARVLDTSTPGSPTEVGQVTIPETTDPAFSVGFGDLTVHEVEVARGDPNEGGSNLDDDKLAYFSWYAGGLRVVDISDPANPVEVGHYIDPAGNNFWGVALAEDRNGNRIVLASDRDFGLFIFRYTGDIP